MQDIFLIILQWTISHKYNRKLLLKCTEKLQIRKAGEDKIDQVPDITNKQIN